LPYTFSDIEDIIRLTSISDYYRALPIVSRTLTDALLKSACVKYIYDDDNTHRLLEAAAKLRHESLFRDCLAWTVNPWAAPKYLKLSDFKFKKAADKVHQDITTKVAEAHRMILCEIGEDSDRYPSTEEKLATAKSAARNSSVGVANHYRAEVIHLPQYFYEIHSSRNFSRSSLPPEVVLRSNLTFSGDRARPGYGFWQDYFFCGEVADEDILWDRTETDW
jgi:hypothetical protein